MTHRTAEEMAMLADEIRLRADGIAKQRAGMVRWNKIDFVDVGRMSPAQTEETLDRLEAEGRVIARAGSKYMLRPVGKVAP